METNHPYQVFFGTTYKCNLNCKHCYVNKKEIRDISLTLIKDALQKLADYGVIKLVFTHGESLIRKDFKDIIAFANSMGFHNTLLSNGILLTEDHAKSLQESGLDKVQISLDSLNKDFHDELRGVPRAWERAVAGIDSCIKNNISTGINTTINRLNYNNLEDYIKFALERNLKEVDFLTVRPLNTMTKNSPIFNFTNKEYKKTIEEVWKLKIQYKNQIIVGFHDPMSISIFSNKLKNDSEAYQALIDESSCQAGKLWFSVLPNGNVQPCNFLPIELGNIYKDEFETITKKLSQFTNLINSTPISCKSCKYMSLCNGGCRAFSINMKERDERCILNLAKNK